MTITETEVEAKRERAFRLLRGGLEVEPDKHPVIAVAGDTIVDPKWGRICLSCETAKVWAAFHKDRSRKSGHRSRCIACTSSEDKERDAKARAEKRAEQEAFAQTSTAETDARTAALERLAEMHPTQFAHFLYSEQVRLGVRKVSEEPRLSEYRPHRSWASTKS